MNRDIKEIKDKIRDLFPHIEKKFFVETIEIFGSYAKMENSDTSDLDILVSFSKTPSLLKFIELKNFLSEKLNLQVDLVLKDSLKESIKDYILNETIKL
ncbi:nucleotidyltransferase family protein [Ignavibacterium sp.]|jgi:hypothetical protein|uniref:nucleotidyltransferase family protein n=1 Tax=Ignavibacterium sp. TaxID=2651167 RepID=UPI003297F564